MTLVAPAFAIFEGWAFVLTVAGGLVLREVGRGSENQSLRLRQHRAHASNTAKRGAAESWVGHPPYMIRSARQQGYSCRYQHGGDPSSTVDFFMQEDFGGEGVADEGE